MAMKGKGVVAAGLLALGASFLSKKENRDKLNDYLNNAKGKANDLYEEQKSNLQGLKSETPASGVNSSHGSPLGEASSARQAIEENEFLSEGGAQQAIREHDKNQ